MIHDPPPTQSLTFSDIFHLSVLQVIKGAQLAFGLITQCLIISMVLFLQLALVCVPRCPFTSLFTPLTLTFKMEGNICADTEHNKSDYAI